MSSALQKIHNWKKRFTHYSGEPTMSNQSVERDTPFPQYLCERHLWKQTEWWESEEKLEKNEKKSWAAGGFRTRDPGSSVLEDFRRWKATQSFSSLSLALAPIMLIFTHTRTSSMRNGLWSFQAELSFSQRETREKLKICCSFSDRAPHPPKNIYFFNFLMLDSKSSVFFAPGTWKRWYLKKKFRQQEAVSILGPRMN